MRGGPSPLAEPGDSYQPGPGAHPGPSVRELPAHSRAWVAAAAWATMLVVGCTQYGYAAFAIRVGVTNPGMNPQAAAWGFGAFIALSSAGRAALPWLRRRLRLTPPTIVIAGTVGCAGGLLALGWAASPLFALAVYAIAAGLGAGLVHGSCVSVTAAWYPERPVRTAMVSGAFGYGAIPFIMGVATARDLSTAFGILVWVMLLVTAAVAPLLREPPGGAPSPAGVIRRRETWILACGALGTWTVALWDMSWLGAFGIKSGFDLTGAALGLAAFAAGSGGIRALAALMADRLARPRIAALAACAAVISQLLLLVAGTQRDLPLLWLAAGCAGAAAGTWYAMAPGLIRSWPGGRPGGRPRWPDGPDRRLLYSARAAGGLLGAGGGGLLVSAAGFAPACVASAIVAGAAALVPLLCRPGLSRTIPGISRETGEINDHGA